jgi:CRP/FNR family transcriptional regulator, polysaccharide utilization system transcription regulator
MRKGNITVDCKNCESRLNSIFCKLEEAEVDALHDNKGCAPYKKGQIVFSQGTSPHGLFVIYSGKVKLYQLAENGREQIVRMSKAGDVIGYRTLLCNDRYTSYAETIEESNICFIPRELFFNIMSKNTSVAVQMMELLSHDLKNAEHRITNLAQKPVRERMAEALLFIKETYGFEQDNKTINVVLTREELANIAGTATETAIRLLSDLKFEKLIEFVGKKIKILDIQKLVVIANIND